jgi:hypothetical protein
MHDSSLPARVPVKTPDDKTLDARNVLASAGVNVSGMFAAELADALGPDPRVIIVNNENNSDAVIRIGTEAVRFIARSKGNMSAVVYFNIDALNRRTFEHVIEGKIGVDTTDGTMRVPYSSAYVNDVASLRRQLQSVCVFLAAEAAPDMRYELLLRR